MCIWDRVKITEGGVSNEETNVKAAETVWFKAEYEYDSDSFDSSDGLLYLMARAHNSILDQEEILMKALEAIDLSDTEQLYEDFEIPRPEDKETDETDWLYDSERDYGTQLRMYKERQFKYEEGF